MPNETRTTAEIAAELDKARAEYEEHNAAAQRARNDVLRLHAEIQNALRPIGAMAPPAAPQSNGQSARDRAAHMAEIKGYLESIDGKPIKKVGSKMIAKYEEDKEDGLVDAWKARKAARGAAQQTNLTDPPPADPPVDPPAEPEPPGTTPPAKAKR